MMDKIRHEINLDERGMRRDEEWEVMRDEMSFVKDKIENKWVSGWDKIREDMTWKMIWKR